MTRVKVKVYFTLSERLGWRERIIELGDDSVFFEEILKIIPELKKVYEEYTVKGFPLVVMINGRRIEFLGGLKAKVKEGDEIAIFPPVAGG
jgi:MoaD family protein